MKVKVVNSFGGVYEYPERLANQLVQMGRVQLYQTRDMRAADPASVTLEVDSNGEVWDAEHHVSTKTKTETGAWRKKPGKAKTAE